MIPRVNGTQVKCLNCFFQDCSTLILRLTLFNDFLSLKFWLVSLKTLVHKPSPINFYAFLVVCYMDKVKLKPQWHNIGISNSTNLLVNQNFSCTWLCISRQNQIASNYREAKRRASLYNEAREKFIVAFPTWSLKPEELLTFTGQEISCL